MALRIFVADDHEVVRRGLCALLTSHSGWEICGEAGDGREAVEKVTQLKPDIVILDIGMPALNGLEAARQIMRNDPHQRGGSTLRARRSRRSTTWSGREIGKPDAKGKLPSVGDTVDVPNATYSNTIGATELIKVWKDPEFDASQRAFYYVRVLEIPTPRWTAYDAKYFGVRMPPEVTMKLQERAYTSPIWYTPEK